MPKEKPEYMSLRDAGLLLGEHPARVYSMCMKGVLHARPTGKSIEVERASVEKEIKRRASSVA